MASSTITYKPVVMAAQRRQDGSYNVKIRITFKRVSRYIATHINAGEKEITGKGDLKGAALIKANRLIADFHEYESRLNYFSLQAMDVDDVIRYIRRQAASAEAFRLDFFEFGYRFADSKKKATGDTYRVALNAFKRYLGTDHIDINELSYTMLLAFAAFLDNEPKQVQHSGKKRKKVTAMKAKGASSRRYPACLNTIYREAKRLHNDEDNGIVNIPRNPFAKLELKGNPSLVRSAREPEFIQRLIDYDGPCTASQRMALDMYLISFALMGMNAADLLTAARPVGDVLIYNRSKTKDRRQDFAEHRVKVDPRIKPLLARYQDPEGDHLTNLYLYYRDNEVLDYALRYALRSWALANDEAPFTLYSARHSWATIARSSRCGVDKATVDECLIHLDPDFKMADVYIEKDWQVLWDANKKVLDLFDWSALARRK